MYGQALSWRMSGPATNNWGQFLCIFLQSFCSRGSRKFFTCCTTIFFKSICHKLHTSFICWCSLPFGLGSLSMLTQQSQEWLVQRETVLWSTVNSPQTSLKAPWNSVGFLLHKVSILLYDLWSEVLNLQVPFLTLVKHRVHYWYNEYTCYFLKPSTGTDIIFTSIALSNPQYCQPMHYFWNGPLKLSWHW